MNLMMLLEMAADGFGDRVALGPSDGGLTYRELYDSAGVASERFRADGGSHVAMADLSSAALPVSLFGAAWAGLPFVPLNYRLTDDELAALASRISPAIIIVDPDSPDRLTGIDGIGLLSRHGLMDNGYRILCEEVLRENRFAYEIIVAERSGPVMYSAEELYFGPLQMQQRSPAFLAKWQRMLRLKQQTLADLARARQAVPEEKVQKVARQTQWIIELLA